MGNRKNNKNNKNSKSKLKDKSQNIYAINAETQSYQDAFDIYRRYPCLPALFALMDKALEAGVLFQEIENELDKLIDIEADQFYGLYEAKDSRLGQSRYIDQKYEELASLSGYRLHSKDALSVSRILWTFLGRIEGQDLWLYEKNYLVGMSDWCYLEDKKEVLESNPEKTSIDNITDRKKLTDLAYQDAKNYNEKANIRKSKAEEATQLGFPMVPLAFLVSDLVSSRPLLERGLSDFSEYLSLYCVSPDKLDLTESTLKKINGQNAISILKIATFCIFAPLFKKTIYKDAKFEIDSFWIERIEHLSSRDSFDDVDDQSEYLVAISNLLMMCAKLDVESVTNGIVSDDELKRGYLSDVSANCLSLACLVPLPSNGFTQILIMINPYETDWCDNALSYALRVSSYEVNISPEPDHLDMMFSYAFQGMDLEIAEAVRRRTEQYVKRWVIPFVCIGDVQNLCFSFWDDEVIVEKISESLFKSDRIQSRVSLYRFENLSDESYFGDLLSEDFHPAIFIKKFSHAVDFWDFSNDDLIKFARSLYSADLTRYASTVLALYLNICGVKKYYFPAASIYIDIPEVSRLLRSLSRYDSFSMISQAIADLFEIYENLPASHIESLPIYKGSLQEYLPVSRAGLTLLKFKKNEDDKFVRYKKILIEDGFPLARLSNQSQDLLVKGYTYSKAKELVEWKLASSAMTCYFQAIESELQFRIPDLDNNLKDELQHILACDITWSSEKNKSGGQNKRPILNGLGAICIMLEGFSKLSAGAQTRLSGINKLALHQDIDLFISSMDELRVIRNPLQHGNIPSNYTDTIAKKELFRIEELLFGMGGIVRILCDSR